MKKLIGLVLGIVFMMALTASVPASASLVAYWDMNTGSGTVMYDSTANANNGDIVEGNGGPPFAGAWTADGGGVTGLSGDYGLNLANNIGQVIVPNSPSLEIGDNLTVDYWVNAPKQPVGAYKSIIQKWGGLDGVPIGWRMQDSGGWGGIKFQVATDAGKSGDFYLWYPLDGTWHHVVFTAGGGKIRGYLDGVEKPSAYGSYDVGSGFSNPAVPLKIDAYNGAFNGVLDEVKIYNNNVIPEPGSLLLLGTGLLGLVSLVRRKRG